MVGGNLRQAGVVAAAGIVALEEMVDRLVEDHRVARAIADGLHDIDPSLVEPETVETNIVNIDVTETGHPAPEWSAALKEQGVLVGPTKPKRLRILTHRHIGDQEAETAIMAFRNVAARFAGERAGLRQ